MTLEAIYFISQIAAAVGIMASLIFVGLQVRQSTKQAKADAVQAVHDNLSAWYMAAAETPFKAEARAEALKEKGIDLNIIMAEGGGELLKYSHPELIVDSLCQIFKADNPDF